jgi:sulfur dioxygenase
LIDLRERGERDRHGVIPGSIHAPYGDLVAGIGQGGVLNALASAGKRLVFYCAFGERSAMAVRAAQDAGLPACHIEGGLDAWKKADGGVEAVVEKERV